MWSSKGAASLKLVFQFAWFPSGNVSCKEEDGISTRMHPSRIRTVRCRGCLSCYTRLPTPSTMHAPLRPTCPLPHMPPLLHVPPPSPLHHACPHYHICSPSSHTLPSPCIIPPPTMDRILDTRLWKHYLSVTTVGDGNEFLMLWNIPLFLARSCTWCN